MWYFHIYENLLKQLAEGAFCQLCGLYPSGNITNYRPLYVYLPLPMAHGYSTPFLQN